TAWGLLEAGLRIDPGAPAIVTLGAPVDYRAFHATAAALASALREAGVARGDRVALAERNTPAFLTWTFACAGAGAVLVPLNWRLAARELAQVVDDAEPVLLVAHASFRDLIEETVERADCVPDVAWLGPGEGALPLGLRPIATAPGAFLPAPCAADDTCHLYYTSGTTGRPKGVPLSHRNVVQHALAATSELDLASDDVWGHVAPMFHLADAWASLAITAVGGAHAFLPEFGAREALALFSELEVTVTNLVPTMLQRMLREAPGFGFDGGALRLVLSGGAPISPRAVRDVLETFRCEYVQTYGLTETSPYLTLAMLEPRHRGLSESAQLARRARTGRAFETVELDVVDDDGRPVPRDDSTVGEIVARGTTITPGYWNRPDETATAFRGGWFHTGDLATIDDEGWVDIVDRKKDMIVTGGENVYSVEVENALYEHPLVLECAAYGVPSEEWGEAVCAAVVLRADGDAEHPDAESLRAHCRDRLAGYKVPRRIELLDELPKTGSGKIAKRLLRDRAEAAGTAG
ncbi:MAG: long-chain-fatty-acid--CoA ligase, partial [Planctomycetota bacterium]